MEKIFSSKQRQFLDKFTIDSEIITSIDLMENAVTEITNKIKELYLPLYTKFLIISGNGNNGGDGFGIARKLSEIGCDVKVYYCAFSNKISVDCKINYERYLSLKSSSVELITSENFETISIPDDYVIVDCIFGSGLNRCVYGEYAFLINLINASKNKVAAVDIPSGLFGEDNSDNDGAIVMADTTISIQMPSLSSMFAENYKYYGDIHIVNINLSKKAIEETPTDFYCLTEKSIAKLIKQRYPFDHKGTYGHALLLAGSRAKAGAAVLAAKSCMRSGVGLLTVHVPSSICDIIQNSIPEAMLDIDNDKYLQTNINCDISKYSAIGVGPGIGTDINTANLIESLLQINLPKVFDADALNIISKNANYSGLSKVIFTPHPKEFERLFGFFSNSYKRILFMQSFSVKNGIVLILKGGVTIISLPSGKVLFYVGKNPGMGTAGCGDVLTGIITALLSQGYSIEDAAAISVFVHGEAGKLASLQKGVISMQASDIIDNLPLIFNRLYELQKS